jgi:tetratricopeptide (TPR) repeat protein
MKKILLILLIIVSNNINAQSSDSLFVEANKLYQQEDYEKALEIYTQIEAQDIVSDDLYYNIANANYKLNKVAPAIYYYEKALMFNPTNEDAAFNLGFAKRMAIDNIEPLPKTFIQKFKDGFVLKLTYNTWAWLAVILLFFFAVLFLLYHFSYDSNRKRLFFTVGTVSLLLAVLSLALAYQNYDHVLKSNYAIVFAQQTEVKTAPTMSSEVNFQLHEGTKVQLLESLDNWKKIKIADGKIGWIIADDIKEL